MRMHLVKARQAKRLSMNRLADMIGIDLHYYYRIEVGTIKRVSFIMMCRIASVLEIDLNKLYRFENDYLKKETKTN